MDRPGGHRDDDRVRGWLRALAAEADGDAPPEAADEPGADVPPIPADSFARILAKARGELPVGEPPRYLPPLEEPPTRAALPAPVRPAASTTALTPWTRGGPLRLALAATILLLLTTGAATILRVIIIRIEGGDGTTREIVVRPGERVEIVNDGGHATSPRPPDRERERAGPADPRPLIVDDADPSYAETGTGWRTGGVSGGFRGRYRYNEAGALTARWRFDGIGPGRYRLYATWVPHPNRAKDVPFDVLDGDRPLARFRVHQDAPPRDRTEAGAEWAYLGEFEARGPTLTVVLDATGARVRTSETTGNSCIADAVMLVPAGPAPGKAEGPR